MLHIKISLRVEASDDISKQIMALIPAYKEEYGSIDMTEFRNDSAFDSAFLMLVANDCRAENTYVLLKNSANASEKAARDIALESRYFECARIMKSLQSKFVSQLMFSKACNVDTIFPKISHASELKRISILTVIAQSPVAAQEKRRRKDARIKT